MIQSLNMLISAFAIVVGLVLLVWSADRFVEGSAFVARHFVRLPLLIGILIVGFDTLHQKCASRPWPHPKTNQV